jgi:flagellin
MNIRNAKDGQSLVDTQEGAMQQISSLLQRMRELAVQASSGTVMLNTADKDSLQVENLALAHEIKAIGLNTKFNDTAVLTGTKFTFHSDIDVAGTSIETVSAAMSETRLNIGTAAISIGGGEAIGGLEDVISVIDTALTRVNDKRASLGAVSNRFDHIVDNLTNVIANTESAKSRVEDADFAVETTQLTRNTVLQQAATSMVAQANASKNMLLALIQG